MPHPYQLLPAALLLLPALLLADDYRKEREQMVEQTIAARGVTHAATLEAMRQVPRHHFVRPEHQGRAYGDHPIPIGHGQTISQPYIVAYMTELIAPEEGHRVLEIGTGSGYQAAILAAILPEVYTMEIIPELADWGAANLRRSGYHHVAVKQGDGYYGWPEKGPFNGIVVTAAAGSIPAPLVEQLADGGRMVIPVGSPFQTQMLMLVERDGESITTRSLMPVRFVPFTRSEEP